MAFINFIAGALFLQFEYTIISAAVKKLQNDITVIDFNFKINGIKLFFVFILNLGENNKYQLNILEVNIKKNYL